MVLRFGYGSAELDWLIISDEGELAMTESITLAWASDIHFDHGPAEGIEQFFDWLGDSGASALLLGGDITHSHELEQTLVEIAELAAMPVHFVLGNHDYYGSSIAGVRERMAGMRHPQLHWLPKTGPAILAPGVTLVGHGGWGDTRNGKFVGSPVFLSDYHAIAELNEAFDPSEWAGTFPRGSALQEELRRRGQEAADILAPHLEAAATTSRLVLVLMHVPPFREATWHMGRHSDEYWLPGFSCGAIGDLLTATASAHPEVRFVGLCGHTHGGGVAEMAPNLVVHTQDAEYGRPDFQVIEVDRDGVRIR
jgi:predicted phosphohydrolase